MAIRLVIFDALHTLLKPRRPIYVQYSQTFEPYLGVLEPEALKNSFKTALKQLQTEKPVYQSGAQEWWGEVIRRTAIGAGADQEGVSMHEALHVGDELAADYFGAKQSGLSALLLRRPGPEGEGEMKEANEDLRSIEVVSDLLHVVDRVNNANERG
ncbi:predicted protein [Postia placenta Mad-698-R]|uniref:Haloacid dehalogenase-like hydrolase domain-containing protein 3 n=1 Tax=Postia placenta MAD-698-R-SB12 TaxID=670580 RepID=A0A1X6ND25_9APHY|nr:hypothetical protein POSPLADRAFT_1132508 [Postia placenta MAD-698-R-SB12]EED78012.1 predicted protein [Postia placenta Mad-698-R]OSX66528.1 hypothetical protein POSPLADRAFT_1132508 [Postia placenta MAD-698-R-SB12]